MSQQTTLQTAPPDSPRWVDRRQVQRNFAQAAAHYAEADFLSREIDRRMLARLDYVRVEPQQILDLGCGTGSSQIALQERYRQARWWGLDLSEAMLQAGQAERSRLAWWLPFMRRRASTRLVADAARLPLADARFDLIWSNQMLHWCEHPLPVFREAQRILQVGGLLMFSALGPDTLRELRDAFAAAKSPAAAAHTMRFADMHDLGDMLLEAGFADPVVDMETLTLTYRDAKDLLRELRAAGGRCAMHGRHKGLFGRVAGAQVHAALAALAARSPEGRLPMTIEVVYGHAWKTASSAAHAAQTTAEGHQILRFTPRPPR